MKIINHSYFEIRINGNKLRPLDEIIVGEMLFNVQAIYSDAGSVEINTEYRRRSFRAYGYLRASESKYLKDANGFPVVIVTDTYPRLIYKEKECCLK